MSIPYENYVRHLQSQIAIRTSIIKDVEQELRALRYDMSDCYEANEQDEFLDLKYEHYKPLKNVFKQIVEKQKTEKDMLRHFLQHQREWVQTIKAEYEFIKEFAHKHN